MTESHLQRMGTRGIALALCATLTLGLAACALPWRAGSRDEHKSETVASTAEDGSLSEDGLSYEGGGLQPPDGYEELPEGFNTEEYNRLTEGGFIAAATRPLSTLSSDVDTASYCNLRRMLRDGMRPGDIPTGAVRIEELLNYFDYDYATPEDDELFAVDVRLGDCPWNEDTKLLSLGFSTAPEATAMAERGSNLVFLIDVSGSMYDDDKLELLKDAFAVLVGQLGENDRVSIVTYAAGEDVVLEGARGDEGLMIMRAIDSLRADGSTNGEAGLEMAYEVAQRTYIEGGVNRIVMASDGDLNVGMSSESDLHDYVEKQRETGVYLSVLGFGAGNYKDNKMEALADHGNGSYHYIDCIEEAERVLGSELTANLVPLADDVKLQVEFNPAQVKAYRLIGYENRALADGDFTDDERDAGDVGPGAQFTVAYELALIDSALELGDVDLKYDSDVPAEPASDEWLTATVRYRPAGGGAVREQERVVREADWSRQPGEDWCFQAAVIEFGMLLRDSEHAGSADHDAIRELLERGGGGADREGFAELVDLALR